MLAAAAKEPLVRRIGLPMPDWPQGAPPLRIAFLTDLHVAAPDSTPRRLGRIVKSVNALRPDIILLGGDFVSDKKFATRLYSANEAVAPLGGLRAPLGVHAVLGNHDVYRNPQAIAEALKAAGINILDNEAISIGPLRLAGSSDLLTGKADPAATLDALRSGPGARVLVTHNPDIAAAMPSELSLILAGHTHCGQIRLPALGAITYMSRFGNRFGCGLQVEGSRRIITSSGIGTSGVPMRLNAPPDLWLIRLGPARPSA